MAHRNRRSAPARWACRWRSPSSADWPSGSRPFAELHHDAARQAGFDPVPPISINSHGYIAETTEQAIEESFPYVAAMMNTIGKERGWPPMTLDQYAASATLHGANFVGSPQDVIDKILFQYDVFHHDRFLVQFSVGTLPHDKLMRSIELLGKEVVPVVKQELARRATESHRATSRAR